MITEETITVGDAMTRGVICVDVKDTIQDVAELMKKNDISSVMVTKDGDGVGIITERDIITKIVAENKDPLRMAAGETMASPLITIPPEADIDDAARVMRDQDIRRLVVADGSRIIGILSEFDIVKLEPALHTLISETAMWDITTAHAAGEGTVAGSCEACENYTENLVSIDGRLLCDECR